MPDAARYMISVAAELVGMHPQTLRIYESKGLVRPAADGRRHAALLRGRPRAAAADPAADDRARPEPRRRRARAAARGRAAAHAGADGATRARAARRDPAACTAPTGASSCSTGPPSIQHRGADRMDFQKLTLKSQEAVAGAQELARRGGFPEIHPEHLTLALLDQELPQTLAMRAGSDAASLRAQAEAALANRPKVTGADVQPRASGPFSRVLDKAEERDAEARRRVRLRRAPAARARRPAARRADRGARRGAGRPARDVPGSGGHVPGAREVRPRPDGARRAGQARPGDRPRRGDPPRDPGALPPDEEQPGADRRPRRRQDRDRRGARPAHRRRRRARRPEGQARLGPRHRRAARGLEVPRRVRGATQGRA